MAESTDNLLPLAILVFVTLAALVVVIVRLVRSGRIPLLAAGGERAAERQGAKA